jgi:hypothetical protein
MGTAYKYVEREAEDQINWAEVGANLTGVLKEENRIREEKKGAIDAATRQYSEVLNSTPLGENTELNKFALNASADLQEQMLMQERLLKSGQLSPREYTIMRQNLTDGTDQAFSLFENYNAEYDIKMARMSTSLPTDEQASIIESWNMELVEGFGNFKESKLVINSRDGIMSMAKMIPDPSYKGTGTAPLIPDMDNLMSVQNMENRLKSQYNKYDVLGQAENYLDSLGADERVFQEKMHSAYKADIFTTISDTTKKIQGGYASMSTSEKTELSRVTGVPINELEAISLFQESQDNWVKGQLGSGGIAGASVILDFRNRNPKTNEKFEPMMDSPKTRELAKTDSNIVIMKNVDGRMVPELSEDQQIYAERILKTAINSGVDYKEEAQAQRTAFQKTPHWKPQYVYEQEGELQEQSNAVTLWNSMYSGDAETRKASAEALVASPQGKKMGLKRLVFSETEDPNDSSKMVETIEFYYLKPEKNRTGKNALIIDKGLSGDSWSKLGIEVHEEVNDKRRQVGLGKNWNTTAINGIESGRDEVAGEINHKVEVIKTLRTKGEAIITKNYSTDNDLIKDLVPLVKGLGITFTDGYGTNNGVWIKGPGDDGTDKRGEYFKKSDGAEAMLNYIESLVTDENAKTTLQLNKKIKTPASK